MQTAPTGLAGNTTLRDILATGTTTDLAGRTHQVPDAINAEEARILIRLIHEIVPRTTLETGTAFGVSALTICTALAGLPSLPDGPPPRRHYGVDPNQTRDYGGAALAALQRAHLDHLFALREGPAHFELPALLAEGVQLDFAFVDGWHTFDYKLLDFFYIDKMLRPGGIVAFHDYLWPSTQKVVHFAQRHRRYEFRARDRRLFRRPPLPRRVARLAKAVLGRKGRTLISSQWAGLRGDPTMAILVKREAFEPNYDFFASF